MARLLLHATAVLSATFTLTSAAPMNVTELNLSARAKFSGGTTSFFSRADCTSPCVENGSCLAGATNKSDLDPNNSYGIWHSSEGISGCWDVPAHAKSLLLTESSGKGFKGSSFTCAQIKKAADTKNWNGATKFPVKFGKGITGNWQCTFLDEEMKSVSYIW